MKIEMLRSKLGEVGGVKGVTMEAGKVYDVNGELGTIFCAKGYAKPHDAAAKAALEDAGKKGAAAAKKS